MDREEIISIVLNKNNLKFVNSFMEKGRYKIEYKCEKCGVNKKVDYQDFIKGKEFCNCAFNNRINELLNDRNAEQVGNFIKGKYGKRIRYRCKLCGRENEIYLSDFYSSSIYCSNLECNNSSFKAGEKVWVDKLNIDICNNSQFINPMIYRSKKLNNMIMLHYECSICNAKIDIRSDVYNKLVCPNQAIHDNIIKITNILKSENKELDLVRVYRNEVEKKLRCVLFHKKCGKETDLTLDDFYRNGRCRENECWIKRMSDINSSEEIKEKKFNTRMINGTFNSSEPENKIYEFLKIKFGEDNIKRQYRSEEFPFECDFYICSLNLYLDFNGDWRHGLMPFNKNNEECIKKLEEWKKKAENSKNYLNAMYVWTDLDVRKRACKVARLEFFSEYEFLCWYDEYKNLECKYDYNICLKELEHIKNSNRGFDSIASYTNKIILTYQPHFYEEENKKWKKKLNWRIKLLENRKKYLNKEDFTNIEILRGFKKSGMHYGFSFFSPFWIKEFIKKYNITSIYDPCGGWGHRLLGAFNIKYIYNDIDVRSYEGVKNIVKDFNIKNKIIYNRDASKFIPEEEYECVFTCPPYFNIEKYNNSGISNVKDYNEFLEWWREVIKHSIKECTKYFCFVINDKFKESMKEVCLNNNLKFIEEIKLGNSNQNNFVKVNNKKGNVEYLVILKIFKE
jgi:hypothetical protein